MVKWAAWSEDIL